MSNAALLTTGYVAAVVLYGVYWVTLKVRIARHERKTGRQ